MLLVGPFAVVAMIACYAVVVSGHAPNSQGKTVQTRNGREAIVLLSKVMDWNCEFLRVKALISSRGTGRDVWYLYYPDMEDSAKEMQARLHSLHIGPRPNSSALGGKTHTFVGWRSKSTTLDFLYWLNASSYSHAWYIEMDTFFTGNWSNVLDIFPLARGSDVIASTVVVPSSWIFWKKCRVAENIDCRNITTSSTGWFIIRVSRRLGRKLMDSLIAANVYGHHEALTRAFCIYNNYSYSVLQSFGVQCEPGGLPHLYGTKSRNLTLAVHNVRPNTLYHPIKCSADIQLGHKAVLWTQPGPTDYKIAHSKGAKSIQQNATRQA
jgi:hypothetical protein